MVVFSSGIGRDNSSRAHEEGRWQGTDHAATTFCAGTPCSYIRRGNMGAIEGKPHYETPE